MDFLFKVRDSFNKTANFQKRFCCYFSILEETDKQDNAIIFVKVSAYSKEDNRLICSKNIYNVPDADLNILLATAELMDTVSLDFLKVKDTIFSIIIDEDGAPHVDMQFIYYN